MGTGATVRKSVGQGVKSQTNEAVFGMGLIEVASLPTERNLRETACMCN